MRLAGALRRWGAPIALILPLAALAVGERALVDHAARRLAVSLASATSGLAVAREQSSPPWASELGIGDPPMASLLYAAALDTTAERGRSTRNAARRGILVREALVARAVASGTRPTGSASAPTGRRPAGVALRGIEGYGSALRDGDVVTLVGGTAATSPGAVVAAIAGAVRSGARVLTAVVWRGDQRIDVAIEIPRPR